MGVVKFLFEFFRYSIISTKNHYLLICYNNELLSIKSYYAWSIRRPFGLWNLFNSKCYIFLKFLNNPNILFIYWIFWYYDWYEPPHWMTVVSHWQPANGRYLSIPTPFSFSLLNFEQVWKWVTFISK